MDASRGRFDPLAAGLGLGVAALAWAARISPLVGVAIGSIAFGVASAGAVRLRGPHRVRHAADAQAAEPPPPPKDRWVRTGERAVVTIDRCLQWLGDGPLRDRLSKIRDEAHAALEDVRTLAAQAAAVKALARRLDESRLSADLTRLANELDRSPDPDVEEDLRRSLAAVREQLGIHRRLETTRKVLQARVESGALGLQHLAAQVSEMATLASPDGLADQGTRLEELTTQLEGLRSGLSEAGALTRRTLGSAELEGETT